jgi:hypothetical protein
MPLEVITKDIKDDWTTTFDTEAGEAWYIDTMFVRNTNGSKTRQLSVDLDFPNGESIRIVKSNVDVGGSVARKLDVFTPGLPDYSVVDEGGDLVGYLMVKRLL